MLFLIFSIFLFCLLLKVTNFRQILQFWECGKKVPGPKPHLIFGHLPDLLTAKLEDLPTIFRKFALEQWKEDNSVMRFHILGNFYIWPITQKSLAFILESVTELDKGADYKFLNPWLGGGLLFEGYGERWRTHRKLLTPSFHFAKLEGYMEVFNNESTILIDCLDEFASSGQTVDLFPYIKRCALDIICATAMGVKIDAQHNLDHPYPKAVEGINKLSVIYSFNPFIRNPLLFRVLGYKSKYDEYLRTLKEFTTEVINERKNAVNSGEVEMETKKRKMNFLDLLLNMEDSNELTSEDIRQEVDTFMFAGHDTTTSSISWACWNLAHNSAIQDRVYEEITDVLGNSSEITTSHLSGMPYLDRVLKESKRLVPPVPAIQRMLREDNIIDGHFLPAGTNITIAPFVVQHNPNVFPNPEVFDPDRFLPEEVARRHPYDYIPFSAGPRNCIGQKFAQLNEKVIVINLIRNFKIVTDKPFDYTKPSMEVVTKPSNGIPVQLIYR